MLTHGIHSVLCTLCEAGQERKYNAETILTMFRANVFCAEHDISPDSFPVFSDRSLSAWNQSHSARFTVWNRMRDHNFCRCLSGDYQNAEGCTRYYFRCPGPETGPDYCRQLVYTAENRLQDGFGENRTILVAP